MTGLIFWRHRLSIAIAAACAVGCGSKKGDDHSKGNRVAAPIDAAVVAPTTPPPTSIVRGRIELVGAPPTMKPLVRKSDRVCAKTAAVEPYVRVGKGGGLADVLVRLPVGSVKAVAPPSHPVVVEQTGCQYRPYVSSVVAGQKLVIRNSDRTAHKVHARSADESVLNRAQPQGTPAISHPVTNPAGTVLELRCDVHKWMLAHVVVTDHGLAAVSDANGTFEIRGVPVGVHDLEAWHPSFGIIKTRITVVKNRVVTTTLRMRAEAYKKP